VAFVRYQGPFSSDGLPADCSLWIVFSTYPLAEFHCCEVSNLYRIHPDGPRMQKLTALRSDQLRATQPRYAPDGKSIVVTAVTPPRAASGSCPPPAAAGQSSLWVQLLIAGAAWW
jgi:hypothetical protein